MLQLIYIFGHVLIVNSRCYGRCYVKKLIPLSTFLKFHTYLDENSVRSFQNVFDKSSKVLNTERFYKWRLSGSARQSQIGILCFDWLIHPGVSYSRNSSGDCTREGFSFVCFLCKKVSENNKNGIYRRRI